MKIDFIFTGWLPKSTNPPFAGFYYVRNEDESHTQYPPKSVRYYDDTTQSWYLPKQSGFEPNNSFIEWFMLEPKLNGYIGNNQFKRN